MTEFIYTENRKSKFHFRIEPGIFFGFNEYGVFTVERLSELKIMTLENMTFDEETSTGLEKANSSSSSEEFLDETSDDEDISDNQSEHIPKRKNQGEAYGNDSVLESSDNDLDIFSFSTGEKLADRSTQNHAHHQADANAKPASKIKTINQKTGLLWLKCNRHKANFV